MNTIRKSCLVLPIIALALWCPTTSAQWVEDGIPICTEPPQLGPCREILRIH